MKPSRTSSSIPLKRHASFSCFPNITTLRLGLFSVEPDEGLIPWLSRPLRGRICLHVRPGCAEFIWSMRNWHSNLTSLWIRGFWEVSLNWARVPSNIEADRRVPMWASLQHSVFTAIPNTTPHILDGAVVTISHFRKLRVLELMANCRVLLAKSFLFNHLH